MRVEITLEKTMRVSKVIDVTKEELEQLRCGDNPFQETMEVELEYGDVEYDYAVNDMDGTEIVPWQN